MGRFLFSLVGVRGGLALPRPLDICVWMFVGVGVAVSCNVVGYPLEDRSWCSVAMIDSIETCVLVSLMRRMQQRVGLERPYFKLTQIPIQFFKLFARMVVREGSFRILDGEGISLMILNRFVSAMFWFASVIVLRSVLRDSFGSGSRCRVIGIFEPPMLRVCRCSVHNSIIAVRIRSAFSLCVEKANPMMVVFVSEK